MGRAARDLASYSVDGSGSPMRILMQRKPIPRMVVSIGLLFMLSGCGLLGCNGAASNGGGFGGCHVGTRF